MELYLFCCHDLAFIDVSIFCHPSLVFHINFFSETTDTKETKVGCDGPLSSFYHNAMPSFHESRVSENRIDEKKG